MKSSYFLFTILFLFISEKIIAASDTLLVKVGNSGITVTEFQERFELMPQIISTDNQNIADKKNNLIQSLIAEKLWALEAEELKLDTSEIMKYTFSIIEKMFVRDALYKIEIADKIKNSPEEIEEGLKRFSAMLKVDVIQSNDSAQIFRIYSLLEAGIAFDSAKYFSQVNLPPLQIKFGEFKEQVEDMLYKLKPGSFSQPVKSSSGWMIFKLINKETLNSHSRKEALKTVNEVLNQRKLEKHYSSFHEKFFKGRIVETDAYLFELVSKKISRILQLKKMADSIPDSENVYLDAADILKMENEMGSDTLSMTFVYFEKQPVTVKQFLRDFIFNGFYSEKVNSNIISAKLNLRVKNFIEQELLAREAYRRGLQNLPEVRRSIRMWHENYLAKILKNMLLDSVAVTDDEVITYQKKGGELLEEVNILEILTDSLEVVESIFKELNKGADFRLLAAQHTKRTWTKSQGGEFGFFPVTMYGELGKIASSLKINDIYGPVKLNEGYSIIKLIDRRQHRSDSLLALKKTPEEVRKILFYEKSAKFFIDYTVKLANKFGISINEPLLNALKVSDYQMLVFRQMGFGGQLTAVPMVLPFNEWYLPWKESKKPTP